MTQGGESGGTTALKSKWINFELKEQKAKTQVWNIISKEDSIILGYIAWYPPWRKYVFFPNNNMVFEKTCLNDIILFIDRLMYERKNILLKIPLPPL